MSRFVFLDRDGTLVADPGYVHRQEDYRLLPGTAAALRRLCDAGFRLAIVTNQSGIGRGLFALSDFERFQERLVDELAQAGVAIDATYFCPHPPEAACDCRKPAPGLLHRAARELAADLGASWVIGDAERDVEMGRRAGCAGAVRIGDAGVPDLAAAVERVLAEAAQSDRS